MLRDGVRISLIPSLSQPTQPIGNFAIDVYPVSPGISPRWRVRCAGIAGQAGANRDPAQGFSFQAALGDFLHLYLPVPAVPSTAGKPLA